MRVYDITVPLSPSTHIWGDGTKPSLTAHVHLDRGDAMTVTSISMGSHSGTHTDAPAHFVAGAATIDELAPQTLVGPALVVEHRGEGHITAADLDRLGVDGTVRRVLFKAGNDALWDEPRFQRTFRALTPDAARRLVELGVKLVGMDYLSVEAYEAESCPVHRILMAAGIALLEGADLRDVTPGRYLLACAPLKMVGAEGAPTRAFLIAEPDVTAAE